MAITINRGGEFNTYLEKVYSYVAEANTAIATNDIDTISRLLRGCSPSFTGNLPRDTERVLDNIVYKTRQGLIEAKKAMDV